ncbi:protein POLLENLESS 3 [Morus notabilis]|uniref:protein POLLENLESS 3 n=1 Tax=Morus notabilis TaxID=981085 RepID=UPI000CED05E9|nr:protein POLLENLESS 3 [Morus notabilis]
MWNNNDHEITVFPPNCRGFLTPPPASSNSLKPSYSSVTSMTECKRRSPAKNGDRFHAVHKIPAGNSPYVRAKQVQLIEKNPGKAISLFWSAINAGDRVDSALKDMAIVMKQLDRSDEAIEAIKSFRHLCPLDSQESIDNVLVELYKRAGRNKEEIEMLENKLKCIEEGTAFGGRRIKTARSQGKKVHITIEQEKARILGNLAWAYLQQNNYITAEEYYRKSLLLESDKNKQCNLAICLMHMNRIPEAKSLLQAVRASSVKNVMDETYAKSLERAHEMLTKLETGSVGGCENSCKEMSTLLFSPTIPRWSQDARKQDTYQFENNGNFEANFTASDNDKSLRFMSLREGCSLKYTQQACPNKAGISTSRTEASSLKKTYFSPAPERFSVRTPFTQPRRCLWGFSDGEERRPEQWRKHVVGNSNKHPSNEEDWRRKNSSENSDKKKSTNDESNLSKDLTTTSPIALGKPMIESSKPTLDSSDCNRKKSWADMVEEEEEETCEYYYNRWNSEEVFSEESMKINGSPCLQTQMKAASKKRECVQRWNSGNEFNDENMNSNIVYESPYLQTQMKNVTRKLEFCNPRDENSTPGNSVWSRNPPARRSLYFGQNQKCGDSTAYSVKSKLRGCISGNEIKLMRRNRLKVFQDITRHPESP